MKRVALLSVSALVLVAIVLFATFQSASTCSVCGCRRQAVDLQVPFLPITYGHFSSIHETPLSQLGKQLKLVPAHRHDWRLIHGSGNGILCALGGVVTYSATRDQPK
jgi:hypothetical protein